MPFIRLCQTREVLPQEIEHYFNAHQSESQNWTWLHNKLHLSKDPGTLFTGSRMLEGELPALELPYSLKHRRGPLFPIKRYRQFEDTANRFRLYPSDALINDLKMGEAFQVQIESLPTRTKDRARKRAQNKQFHPESPWDQFESRTWFKWRIRNLIGALWRSCRDSIEMRNSDLKQSLRHDREAPREAILDKLSRPLFKVKIRASRPFSQYSLL